MSWKPPPSFASSEAPSKKSSATTTTTSRKGEIPKSLASASSKNKKRANWAPAFVAGQNSLGNSPDENAAAESENNNNKNDKNKKNKNENKNDTDAEEIQPPTRNLSPTRITPSALPADLQAFMPKRVSSSVQSFPLSPKQQLPYSPKQQKQEQERRSQSRSKSPFPKSALKATNQRTGDSPKSSPRSGGVNWNQTLFVVDNPREVGDNDNDKKDKDKDKDKDNKTTDDDDDDNDNDNGNDDPSSSTDQDQDHDQVPPIINPLSPLERVSSKEIRIPSRGDLGVKRFISKKETLIVDQAMLQTRLEWNQLLVSKAFRPYRQMICAVDDDLPNPEDLQAMEEDDYLMLTDDGNDDDNDNDNDEMDQIRDEMLDDPDLTEREIAAFLEGFKLFQIKVNSLQAQLQGLKTMQRLHYQAAIGTTTSRPVAVASERNLFRRSASVATPMRFINRRGGEDLKDLEDARTNMREFANNSSSNSNSNSNISGSSSSKPSEDAASSATDKPIVVNSVSAPSPSAHPSKETLETTAPTEQPSAPRKQPSPDDTTMPPHRRTEENNSDSDRTPPRPKRESRSNGTKSRTAGPLKASKSLRALSIQRIRETTSIREPGNTKNEDIRKLLEELEEAEKRQHKLEKQLAQAGVVIAEDIPYDLAKQNVERIAVRMGEIGGSDVADPKLKEEYFKLEQDMEKYSAALQLTDEWAEEQEELERRWEASVTPSNEEAIRKLRRHMPVEVRNMSEAALCTQPTPNGKFLPKQVAKKFKRTNALQLLRIDPEDIVPMHPSTLENMRVTGFTLTERRALYHHLRGPGPRWKAMQADKMTERKWTWFSMMKSNFKENVDSWQRHVDQYGPPGNHPYATRENPDTGCPLLGKQCPLKADKMIDYDGDYGFPEDAQYFSSEVKKSDVDNVSKANQEALEAAREKKSLERSDALKKHYKGKILQVSLANGICETIDETMEKMEGSQERWIKAGLTIDGMPTDDIKKKQAAAFKEALNELKLSILQFAERSGMQLTGKRDANADQPDLRSMVELALCEEVIETAEDFFKGVEERMEEFGVKDGRMKSTIKQLRTLMDELHERNFTTMETLGEERPPRSRKLKNRQAMKQKVQKELAKQEDKAKPAGGSPGGPPRGMPGQGGRGDMLSALQGRGRGGDKGGGGGLLGAIAGQGGGGGGRGGLMSAIAGRGAGGGGRGGLMSAIAGRGDGGGGCGGLMAAIAAKGEGEGG